jgi:hypothetical protein
VTHLKIERVTPDTETHLKIERVTPDTETHLKIERVIIVPETGVDLYLDLTIGIDPVDLDPILLQAERISPLMATKQCTLQLMARIMLLSPITRKTNRGPSHLFINRPSVTFSDEQ